MMTGRKYALILSFLCWLSLILFNWLQLFGIIECGLDSFVHLLVFVVHLLVFVFIGFLAGSYASEKRK